MSAFSPPEQQVEILRRMDLAGEPWEVRYFSHERQGWIIQLCDDRAQMKALIEQIVEGIEE